MKYLYVKTFKEFHIFSMNKVSIHWYGEAELIVEELLGAENIYYEVGFTTPQAAYEEMENIGEWLNNSGIQEDVYTLTGVKYKEWLEKNIK